MWRKIMGPTKVCENFEVYYPDNETMLDQDEEWIEVSTGEQKRKIRIHDYDIIYSIPGLYEEVVYNRLQCCSPEVVTNLLAEAVQTDNGPKPELNVLDFGAGNGVVGEYLARTLNCNKIIGVDIIPEAKEAAYRDRPDVYDDYFVLDFCSPKQEEKKRLEAYNINTLVTVAALGFHDISTNAFLKASELLPEGGWIAFNIRDKFLSDTDCSGFHTTIEEMMNDRFKVVSVERYCHRKSLCGEELHYYAIVARNVSNSSIEERKRTLSELCADSR